MQTKMDRTVTVNAFQYVLVSHVSVRGGKLFHFIKNGTGVPIDLPTVSGGLNVDTSMCFKTPHFKHLYC